MTGMVCLFSTHSPPTYIFMAHPPPSHPHRLCSPSARQSLRHVFSPAVHVGPVERQHPCRVQGVHTQPPVPRQHRKRVGHVGVWSHEELHVAKLAGGQAQFHFVELVQHRRGDG